MQDPTQNNPILNLNLPLDEAAKAQTQTLSTTFGKQLSIYLICFFLPPFGLISAYKYVKQKDPKCKKIGYIAIALTLASILLTFIVTRAVLNTINNELNSQKNLYKDIGI